MLSFKDKKIREQSASFSEEHLYLLRPFKILDRGQQERFILPDIRDLKGTPFELCADEVQFACGLLDTRKGSGMRKHNLWLFRSHQQKYAGDFVIVDVSSPPRRVGDLQLPRWEVFVLDLKRNARLQLGGGGAGIQLKHWEEAAQLAFRKTAQARQVYPEGRDAGRWERLAKPKDIWRLVGSREEVLAFFFHLKALRREQRRVNGDKGRVLEAFRRLRRIELVR